MAPACLLEPILELSDQGIMVLDEEGRCTLINRAAALMTGWSEKAATGRRLDELIQPPRFAGFIQPSMKCAALEVLAKGVRQLKKAEVYWRRDGTTYLVESSATPIIEDGRNRGTVIVFTDISDRQIIEKNLRDREAALRLLSEVGPTLIAYFDADCGYRWINKAYAYWCGLTTTDIQGYNIRQILGKAAWQTIQPLAHRALSGESATYEHQLELPDGPRWVRGTLTPDRDESGQVRGFVEHAMDIFEHKEAQQTYRATLNILEDFDEERRNVQLLQKATLNLLDDMHDERNRVDRTQRATLNILEDFNEEKDKLQNLQLATMNLLEDVDEERRNFQLIQKATLNLLEDMNVEREKSEETQKALMNILDDVEAERIKTEQAKAMLESVNKELEAFSYSVSHDLRAPLRAISGFAEALIEDWEDKLDEDGRRYLDLVQENAHKMGQLIDDLLAFSRLGRQTMMVAEFDIAELAQAVFAELKAHAPERKIIFEIEKIPPARGDRALIRQVLINLISNAIKFTRTREIARIEFGFSNDRDQTTYYIRDNGVGFEMEYVGKLFGVFQRLHAVTEFEGTGVGLALVYRIITRHGGIVRAEGKVDQGATFYFSLPKQH